MFDGIAVRRVALILLTGFTARLKYYFVWSVAEAGLIMSGQCYSGLSQKVTVGSRWSRETSSLGGEEGAWARVQQATLFWAESGEAPSVRVP